MPLRHVLLRSEVETYPYPPLPWIRQDFLNCREGTRWEDVNRVLLNWEKGHKYGQCSRLFCLASIERLPFDTQRRAALAIREYVPSAVCPLLLISGEAEPTGLTPGSLALGLTNQGLSVLSLTVSATHSTPSVLAGDNEGQHLVTQYAHCRVSIDPLPLEVLQVLIGGHDHVQAQHRLDVMHTIPYEPTQLLILALNPKLNRKPRPALRRTVVRA